MALEPVIPELEEDENPELKDFSRRFWWTLPLTVIVTVLAMTAHQLQLLHGATQNWVELILATPVTLWAGWPFFVRGVASIRNRSPNMWTLIGLGTAAAYLYSVAATVFPQVFPTTFMQDGRIGVYFEAAAVIISLTLLGQMLELKARSQTSAAIKSLLGLAPRRPVASGPMVRRKIFRSPTCIRATTCAFALARRCRSTGWSWKAKVLSMNPC
jgi:Cu+-exporting ATPase